MLRSLPLAALALLLAAPVLAQTGTALFGVTVFDGTYTGPLPGTPFVIYSADLAAPVRTAVSGDSALGSLVLVPGLPPGRYHAFPAASTGLLTLSSFGLDVAADSTSVVSIDLETADPERGVVRGRIVDATTGAPVRFYRVDGYLYTPGIENGYLGGMTDGEGRFAVQAYPGTYTTQLYLEYNAYGPATLYGPAAVTFTATAGGTTDVGDLAARVRPVGRATGTVTDAATGAPRSGIAIFAYGSSNFGYGAVSEPDGRFAFDLPAGDYVFESSTEPPYLPQAYRNAVFLSGATVVTVAGNATTVGIDFALRRAAADFSLTVSGRVTDTAGLPVPGATVTVYDDSFVDAVPAADSVATLADGTFSFVTTDAETFAASLVAVGVRAGGFRPEFFDGQSELAFADLFEVGGDAVAFNVGTVVLVRDGERPPGFAVSGTVRAEATGAPLAGAVVAVARTDAPGVRYVRTDAAGAYRVGGLAAGTYVVLFTETNHAPQFYPAAASWTAATAVPVAGDVGGLDALMGGLNRPVASRAGTRRPGGGAASGEIAGAVRDALGATLDGALVVARGLDGAAQAFALTDAAGRFALSGLGEAPVTIDVDRARYVPASVATGPSPGGQMVVTLAAAAPTAADGTADARAALAVFPNPARGRATVAFDLAAPGEARVTVVDVLGREVAVAASGVYAAGPHAVALDTSRLPAGVYVVRLTAGGTATAVRVTVVR